MLLSKSSISIKDKHFCQKQIVSHSPGNQSGQRTDKCCITVICSLFRKCETLDTHCCCCCCWPTFFPRMLSLRLVMATIILFHGAISRWLDWPLRNTVWLLLSSARWHQLRISNFLCQCRHNDCLRRYCRRCQPQQRTPSRQASQNDKELLPQPQYSSQ